MRLPVRESPLGKQPMLMATCLCDTFYDDVARATVEVLEFSGCKVSFPVNQICCGQPAYNGGDWEASRKVVRHTVRTFQGENPVVIPSGSCAAMLFHGAPLAFEKERDFGAVRDLAARTWELADYLVHGLGIEKWSGRFPHRIAFHRSCHSRETKSGEAAMTLLTSIEGLEWVEFEEEEQCCGFGGTFSVAFPYLSTAIGALKLKYIREADPEFLVSSDMGCLLHLGGMLDQKGLPLKRLHFAQVLRDALKNGGLL